MAIPFNVPSDEQSDSEWVLQFQMILKRNILNLLNEIASIRDNNHPPPESFTTLLCRNAAVRQNARADLEWLSRQQNLPQLITSALSSRGTIGLLPAQNARRRRHRNATEEAQEEPKHVPGEPAEEEVVGPAQIGAFLRQIADDIQADSLKEESEEKESRAVEVKTSSNRRSFLSKLMPTYIRSSLWTALICVIGWHLFRAR